ncbi:MAG: hypothetical protein EOO43_24270 [Flavobacterium sp.]|nr:MAG: hypothetical protein EOO43_24270 [Flavobacterium sp.]
MLSLLHSGYIDNQGYVSEDLDLRQELWLDSKYKNIKDDIKYILSQNFIEVIGEISVSPSLNISETKPLQVSTLSKGTISVAIQLSQLETEKNPYFLVKTYKNLRSTITNERSLLLLEGSLSDINQALKEVLIHKDLNSSPAIITITDGINKPITHPILLEYFTIVNETIFLLEENNTKYFLIQF